MSKISAPRNGDWFLTYSGKKFYPLDPQPEDVCVEDIAHHLSLVCRFNGGSRVHYSVAQHSIMVCDILPPELQRYGLMHDSPEAYIGDMVKPLKRSLPDFKLIEEVIWGVIKYKYQITLPTDGVFSSQLIPGGVSAEAKIKEADNIALMTERRDLLRPSSHLWSTREQPLPAMIIPWTPEEAEHRFMERFDELFLNILDA